MAGSSFAELLSKELYELSQERIVLVGLLLGPLLVYLVFGGLALVAGEAAGREYRVPLHLALVAPPGDPLAARLASEIGARLYPSLPARGFDAAIVLPEGVSPLLEEGRRVPVEIYVNATEPTLLAVARARLAQERLQWGLASLLAERCRASLPGASPESLLSPGEARTYFLLRGRTLEEPEFYGLLAAASLAAPLSVFIVTLAASQVAAVSMGLEREARTLEKLISLPVPYGSVIAAKVAAVTILSLGGALSSLAGMAIYLGAAAKAASGLAPGLQVGGGLRLTPLGGLAAGAATLLVLYQASLIGFIVGSSAEDVRGSQVAANIASVSLSVPLFLYMMGASPGTLGPLGAAMLLDPYVPAVIAYGAAVAGDPRAAAGAVAILAAEAGLLTIAAPRLLDPEAILLGLPLRQRLARALSRR